MLHVSPRNRRSCQRAGGADELRRLTAICACQLGCQLSREEKCSGSRRAKPAGKNAAPSQENDHPSGENASPSWENDDISQENADASRENGNSSDENGAHSWENGDSSDKVAHLGRWLSGSAYPNGVSALSPRLLSRRGYLGCECRRATTLKEISAKFL
jgi:hypothetical protein